MNKSEKFWDKRSKGYDKRSKKYEEMYFDTIRSTKKHLTNSDTVLDFACGTGIITNEIAGYVKKIYAIDISSKMIEVAKRKAGERNIENIDFAQSTIFDESYTRGSFDVILAFNVLHLLEDTQKVVQQINELLKPGGAFISTTPCRGKKKTFLSIMMPLLTKMRIAPYIKIYEISELEGLVASSNFQIVESENLNDTPLHHFIAAKKKENT